MAKEVSTIVMMTKKEAREAVNKANLNFGAGAAILKDLYNREGWKALGYSSWKACAEKEFQQGRARVYQIMDEAKIEKELGPSAPALSGRAVRALKDVPPGQRKAALAEVQAEHKTKTPTGTQVSKSVKSKWARSGVNKPAKQKPTPIAEQAKDDDELKKALAVLGGTCGREFRAAIESGTVDMTRHEIIQLSEQDDETMSQAEKLISVNRWPLKRALSFLNEMPSLNTKLEQLTWLAVASPEDKWEGSFGAFKVIVEVNRKKL